MEINKKELYFLCACFIWITPFYLPTAIAVLLRCGLIALVMTTQKIKFNPMLGLTLVYVIMTIVSTFVFDYGMTNLLKTVSVMSVFVSCILCASNPSNNKAMSNGMLKGMLLYFLIDAYFIFVQKGIGMNDNAQPLYFSGGKFDVCYLYLFLMILVFLKCKRMKKYQQLLMVLFGMFMSFYVDCTTGVLGIFAFCAVMFLPEKFKAGKIKYWWIGGMLLIHYLIVFVQIQSTNPWLSYFITEVLNKQITLTGRVKIYNRFGEIMQNHWLFGYGYTSDRIIEVTKLANTQNGFLQVIYVGGLVSFAVFMIMMFYIIAQIIKIKNKKEQNILFSALMAFFSIAVIEIPFHSVLFYMLLAIIYVYSCREKGVKDVQRIT